MSNFSSANFCLEKKLLSWQLVTCLIERPASAAASQQWCVVTWPRAGSCLCDVSVLDTWPWVRLVCQCWLGGINMFFLPITFFARETFMYVLVPEFLNHFYYFFATVHCSITKFCPFCSLILPPARLLPVTVLYLVKNTLFTTDVGELPVPCRSAGELWRSCCRRSAV